MTYLVERLAELRRYLDHLRAIRPRVTGRETLERDLSLTNDVLFSLLTVCQLVIDIAGELSARRGDRYEDYTLDSSETWGAMVRIRARPPIASIGSSHFGEGLSVFLKPTGNRLDWEVMRSLKKHAMPPEILSEIIRRVVEVEVVQPEKIILFGSAARGEMGPNSDVDLLVVKSGAYRLDLTGRIYMNLRGVGVAVDVIVVTPEDVEKYRNSHALVIAPALQEGKLVYAA